jgi:preprotein translocase subunit SecG
MPASDIALIAAGVLGSAIAIIHGVLMQRYMIAPIQTWFDAGARMNSASKALTPILLHLTTLYWFAGGLALVAAALWFGPSAKLATSCCVAALYVPAVIGNFIGTKGRHPGWVLYAISTGLIGYSVFG